MNIYKSLLFTILIIAFTSTNSFTQADFQNPFRVCWEVSIQGIVTASDNAPSGTVTPNFKSIIVYTDEGDLSALDYKTGEKLWESSIGGEIIYEPVFAGNDLFVITEIGKLDEGSEQKRTRVLRSISALTGITRWEQNFGLKNNFIHIKAADSITFLSDDSVLSVYDVNSGDLKINASSKKNLKFQNFKFPAFTLLPDIKVFSELEQNRKFDKILIKKLNGSDLTALNADESHIYMGDRRGLISVSDRKTGKNIWEKRLGGAVSTINIIRSGVLVGSFDNFLYLLDIRSGDVLWKRRFNGRITDPPEVFGESAIVYIAGEKTVFFVNLKDGKVFNRIDVNEDFVSGRPYPVEDLVIVPTENKLTAYSTGKCPS